MNEMSSKKICHLKLTLMQRDGSRICDASGMKLARAKHGITRDLLFPGDGSLYELHIAIQQAFGWGNYHLHRFSLRDKDFGQLTEGSIKIYKKLCGNLFRAEEADSFEWHWHELFREVPFEEARRGDCPTEESLYANLIKTGGMDEGGQGYKEADQDEDNIGEELNIANETNIRRLNILLERLKAEEVFTAGKYINNKPRNDKRNTDIALWRETVLSSAFTQINRMLKFFEAEPERTDYYCRKIKELEDIKKRYSAHMSKDNKESSEEYTVSNNRERLADSCRKEILKSYDEAGELINSFIPKIRPFFSVIDYRYDCGDGWYVRVSCKEIYDEQAVSVVSEAKESGIYSDESGAADWIDDKGACASTTLRSGLEKVAATKLPLCIAADGIDLFDDIGGVDGYFSFLRALYGKNKNEAMHMRELAEAYGWRGKAGVFR